MWDRLSPAFQATVRDQLAPLYQQLVLQVDYPMERAAGLILVQLSWLEAWNFERTFQELFAPPDPLEILDNLLSVPQLPSRVAHQRPLAAAKGQAAQLLSMLRHVRQGFEPTFPKSVSVPPPSSTAEPAPETTSDAPASSNTSSGGRVDSCLEDPKCVDQNLGASPALAFVRAHAMLFERHGTVVATYRKVGPRVYGPYYRLAYRVDGRQQSLYIGRDSKQADAVRTALKDLQAPRRRLREMDACEREVRRSLQLAKLQALPTLHRAGLRFHGHEIRGWRDNPMFAFLPRRRSHDLPLLPRPPRISWPQNLFQSLNREAQKAADSG